MINYVWKTNSTYIFVLLYGNISIIVFFFMYCAANDPTTLVGIYIYIQLLQYIILCIIYYEKYDNLVEFFPTARVSISDANLCSQINEVRCML